MGVGARIAPAFYRELEAQHIPRGMPIYAYSGHGFALRPTQKPGAPVMGWPERSKE
jgi:hypothetical protein